MSNLCFTKSNLIQFIFTLNNIAQVNTTLNITQYNYQVNNLRNKLSFDNYYSYLEFVIY